MKTQSEIRPRFRRLKTNVRCALCERPAWRRHGGFRNRDFICAVCLHDLAGEQGLVRC